MKDYFFSEQVAGKLVSEDKLSQSFLVTTNPLVVGFAVIGMYQHRNPAKKRHMPLPHFYAGVND